MISEGGSFGQLGVHVGTDGRVWCHTYADRGPILIVSAASTTVTFSLAGDQPSAGFAQFARALARGAERFAAEAERLHTERRAVEQVRDQAAARQDSTPGAA